MSGCGSCGGCGSSNTSSPKKHPSALPGSSCDSCSCGGSCGGNCACNSSNSNLAKSGIRYTEVPLGLPEDHSEIKKPSDGFYVGMRVYNRGTNECGTVTEVRYNDCAIKVDDSGGRTSVFNCRFLMPEEEGDAYEEKNAILLTPIPLETEDE